MSKTLIGTTAIEYAHRSGLSVSKYADPTEGGREFVPLDEARQVCREDASLIYLNFDPEAPCYQGLNSREARHEHLDLMTASEALDWYAHAQEGGATEAYIWDTVAEADVTQGLLYLEEDGVL